MKISSQSSDTSPTPPNQHRSTALLMLADIADTTWRMFFPTLSLMALGMWADGVWETAPLLILLGLGVGILIAALLVRQQFQRLRKTK